MKDLVIFGAGSLARLACHVTEDINEELRVWNIIGFLDQNIENWGEVLDGYPILGDENWLRQYSDLSVFVAIGRSSIRQRLISQILKIRRVSFSILIHPSTWIGKRVNIGEGTITCPGVKIGSDTDIGNHVILNLNCTITHDIKIRNFVRITPGVAVGGNVIIEEGTELGLNSCVIPGISIGHWSIIGAGTTVINNIPDNVTVVGEASRIIGRKEEGWEKLKD